MGRVLQPGHKIDVAWFRTISLLCKFLHFWTFVSPACFVHSVWTQVFTIDTVMAAATLVLQQLAQSPTALAVLGWVFLWLCWRLWRFSLLPALCPDEPKELPYLVPRESNRSDSDSIKLIKSCGHQS
jgi:hypothetical protein